MCGIVGFLSGATYSERLDCIGDMAAALRHRGPDYGDRWIDRSAGVALGHRRLSILDLSPSGNQPMASADGRYVIAFNGEIYNYLDIRAELEATGSAPAWRGHSDTEVMLAAIVAWGLEPAVKKFVGMFAFGLWDRERRLLHLCRDRMGEKPLYYAWHNDAFLFGSELKALRCHPVWREEIDRGALALGMRHNYIPAPYTIYKDAYKLPPGTILTVKAEALRGSPQFLPTPYWSLAEVAERGIAQPFAGSEADAIDELERIVRRSIRMQMIADVPLGAFLSGGIDSSTVVSLMQSESRRPIKTFTIGFKEQGYNEAEHAKAVAKHLGTEHTELYVTPEEAMAVIPLLPALYDEPFSDSSQIPTYLVAKLAKTQVTVALSGDGGDELFGGYNRYFLGRTIHRRVYPIPSALRAGAARALTAISPANWDKLIGPIAKRLPARLKITTAGDRVHKLAEVLGCRTPQEMYRNLVSHWKEPTALVSGSEEPPTILTDSRQLAGMHDFTHRMMYLDAVSYLPDDILVKVDRASMGVSLETRVPFLDHRVVEFAWTLPLAMKIKGNTGKWPLRRVLARHVPSSLTDRPKVGFGVPIDAWLRGPLREWAEELLRPARIRAEGYFDSGPIETKWREHLSGRRNWQYYLWDVLMFQSWLEVQRQS